MKWLVWCKCTATMLLLAARIIIFIGLANTAAALEEAENRTMFDLNSRPSVSPARRHRGQPKAPSTSSSGSREASSKADPESMDMSSEDGSSGLFVTKKSILESSGWKKWHRECHACTADMVKKWRDPTIEWICGGYQRARRTFKSQCMMFYRNCQDGTMFVEIHKGRCANDTAGDPRPHGHHFFYEYQVVLSQDSASSPLSSERNTDSY